MSVFRVLALGIGWIVLLAGSVGFLSAGVLAVGVTSGAAFAPGWNITLLVAGVGVALMISALPMMFFGCEADRQGKTTGFAPLPDFVFVGPDSPSPTVPMALVPATASSTRVSTSHLSSFAVTTLEHRR